jgi:O-methyltransferase involved in polyketide biosynthesis
MEYDVVVVGAGLDTRAFRMPWPRGTAVFELGHRDVHQFAAAALRSVGAMVSVAYDVLNPSVAMPRDSWLHYCRRGVRTLPRIYYNCFK